MSPIRKTIVLALLGLIVGAGLGVGYLAWSKLGFPLPGGYGNLGQPQIKGLVVTCSGGTKPVVLVTWTQELDPFAIGLQKSIDGGRWQALGQPLSNSGQPHFLDTDVQPNTTYFYRIMKGWSHVSATVSITTDGASCSPKQ
jgi:hypothetical protein